MCALVFKETGLLPHVNPGVMTREDITVLRDVSASQGVMLESAAARLCEPGGVHYGSPDKRPERCGWKRSGWRASWRCRSPPGS